MKHKPVAGQKVRLTDNTLLREPVPVGSEGICTGDMFTGEDFVWVKFDNVDDQQVKWATELEEP